MKRSFVIQVIFGISWFVLAIPCGACGEPEDIATGVERVLPAETTTEEHTSGIALIQCASSACSRLKEGKELLDAGRYAESIEKVKTTYEELPTVRDYALFFMARAFSKMKEFDKSDEAIDSLLKTYPESPLKKRARSMRIRNDLSRSGGLFKDETDAEIMRSLEQYVADYPDDGETKVLLAHALKKRGEKERAKVILREVYASNGPFADIALKELGSSVTVGDMLERASALIKNGEYKKAETLLKRALQDASDSSRDDVLRKIGHALFRQKRYREAASEFAKAGDTYNAARSLYRAGDVEAFQRAVSKLISMEDKRAGSLRLVLAAKKRREGNAAEALKIYEEVKNSYPSLAEDALWGRAWTLYRMGDYRAAYGVLSDLGRLYPDSRYLYWKMRCADNITEGIPANDGASDSLVQGAKSGRGFYDLLLGMRTGKAQRSGNVLEPVSLRSARESCSPAARDSSEDTVAALSGEHAGTAGEFPSKDRALSRLRERFSVLAAIGMREEAVSEVMRASREISNPAAVLSLGRMLNTAGAYKSAIALASRMVKSKEVRGSAEDVEDILYPLAYWSIVEKAAGTSDLDPLILLAVMREESRFDPDARSAAGALGLMQLMPQTAERLAAVGTTAGILDVKTNIAIGASYFNLLMKEFDSLPAAIAAYNAGEERVRDWVKRGNYTSSDEFIEDIPFDETRNYVKKVIAAYSAYREKTMKRFAACGNRES